MNLRRALIMSLALGVASPAFAQDSPSEPSQPDIVVRGQALERQVRDFVRALAPARPRGQIARFEWEVCPAVTVGLSETQTEAVVARMREVAESVGMPLGAPGCRPNILVAAAPEKRAFLQELSRRQPVLFATMSRDQRRRIEEEPLATSWHISGPPLNAEGRPLSQVRLQLPFAVQQLDAEVPPEGITAGASPEGVYMDNTARAGSRITSNSRLHFTAAVVVIEEAAIDGLSTTQIADYAAMRAFSAADPTRLPESPPPTILRAVGAPIGSEVPITLTKWDVGFLRGLYGSDPRLFGGSQRSEIAGRIRDELETPETRSN